LNAHKAAQHESSKNNIHTIVQIKEPGVFRFTHFWI